MFRKKAIPAASRREIALRHGCKPGQIVEVNCKCGSKGCIAWDIRGRQKLGYVQFSNMEIDHVIPEFRGGSSRSANLQLLCRKCNRTKGYRE